MILTEKKLLQGLSGNKMTKRILIVDDVLGWIRFHKNNLEYLNLDLDIDAAYSAKEALAKIECSIDNPYSVILTDLQMESDFLPKLAGEWFVEQVKMFKEYQNANIVIISASPDISIIANRLGVKYFSKTDARNCQAHEYERFL